MAALKSASSIGLGDYQNGDTHIGVSNCPPGALPSRGSRNL
jgi:hypothetical protein